MTIAQKSSPSALRNREPILHVLERVLPRPASILELASGSGQHAAFFARALPDVTWTPTDRDLEALASVRAWCEGLPNVREPVRLDVREEPWPVSGPFDALVAINLVHISPWDATLALLHGAAARLRPGGIVFLYGAYKRDGAHTAPSNEAFDGWLRATDPAFGVRDLEAVVAEAEARGLALAEVVSMPANNLCVVLRKT